MLKYFENNPWVPAVLVALALALLILFLVFRPKSVSLLPADLEKATLKLKIDTVESYDVEAVNPRVSITAILNVPQTVSNINRVGNFRLDLANIADGQEQNFNVGSELVQKFTYADFANNDLLNANLSVNYKLNNSQTLKLWGNIPLNTDELNNALVNFTPGQPSSTVVIPIDITTNVDDSVNIQVGVQEKFYKLVSNPQNIGDISSETMYISLSKNETPGNYNLTFLSHENDPLGNYNDNVLYGNTYVVQIIPLTDETGNVVDGVFLLLDTSRNNYIGFEEALVRNTDTDLATSDYYLGASTFRIFDVTVDQDSQFYINHDGSDFKDNLVQEINPVSYMNGQVIFVIIGNFVNIDIDKNFVIDLPELNNLFGTENDGPLTSEQTLVVKNIMNEIFVRKKEFKLMRATDGGFCEAGRNACSRVESAASTFTLSHDVE